MQSTGTDHTLGVAIKYDGNVSWSTSGTQTKSFGGSSSTNYGAASSIIQNKVNYRKYRYGCAVGALYFEDLLWRPNNYHSLNTGQISVSRPTSWSVPANCTAYSSGTHIKNRGSNATCSTGVDLTVL